jgi:hypothetical protein
MQCNRARRDRNLRMLHVLRRFGVQRANFGWQQLQCRGGDDVHVYGINHREHHGNVRLHHLLRGFRVHGAYGWRQYVLYGWHHLHVYGRDCRKHHRHVRMSVVLLKLSRACPTKASLTNLRGAFF